jgi:hypothetical protein
MKEKSEGNTMERLRKCISVSMVLILLLLLSACGGSFKYDKEAAVKNAQELITKAYEGDYQAVIDMLHEGVKSQLPVKTLRDSWEPLFKESGAFVEFANATATGATQDGVNYIVTVVPCKFENNTRTFTITFTEDLKVVSLEMK